MDGSWFGRHKCLTVILILIALGVLFAAGYAIRVAMLPARVARGALSTMEGAIDRTFDPDRALINYHRFRNWYQVYNKAIADAKLMHTSMQQLEQDYPTPMARPVDVRQDLTDYKFKRDASLTNANRVAAEYNAAASDITMSIFKGEWLDKLLKGDTRVDLPDELVLVTSANIVTNP
jgi:hypothetical protein